MITLVLGKNKWGKRAENHNHQTMQCKSLTNDENEFGRYVLDVGQDDEIPEIDSPKTLEHTKYYQNSSEIISVWQFLHRNDRK